FFASRRRHTRSKRDWSSDVCSSDLLSEVVRDYDPELALFAKENGLYAYRRILEQAKQMLQPGGQIVFEIGFDQGQSVPSLAKNYFPNASIHVFTDINGHDRIVTITT